jgi:hypothetical protein
METDEDDEGKVQFRLLEGSHGDCFALYDETI